MDANQSDEQKPTREYSRQRRISLKKSDLELGLAAELLLFLQNITSDGRISEAEAHDLRVWLRNPGLPKLPGLVCLNEIIEHVLADGCVSDEEQETLYRTIEKVLPPEDRRMAREHRKAASEIDKLKVRTAKEEQKKLKLLNKPILEYDIMVAGARHGNRQTNIFAYAKRNAKLVLEREPDNPNDPNAIRVVYPPDHLFGYVPMEYTEMLAQRLDAGMQTKAWVKKVIEGPSHDIPVVIIEVYDKESTAPGIARANRRAFTPDGVKKSAGCCLGILIIAFTIIASGLLLLLPL